MAVQPTSSRTVPLYVLIVFIVLFVAAVTTLVILFLNQEQLQQQAKQATDKYEKFVGSRNERDLNEFVPKGERMKPRATAVGALLAERAQLAKLLTGRADETTENIKNTLDTMLTSLPAEAAALKSLAQVDLVGAMGKAVGIVKGFADQVTTLRQQLKDSENRSETTTRKYRQMEQTFNENTARITEQLKSLEAKFQTLKNDHAQQLQAIEGKVGKDLKAKLAKAEESFSQDIDGLSEMVRRNLQSLIRSIKELGPADQRAKATLTVEKMLQKSDGQVLTIAGDVIYITLGAKHGVNPGMRFYVYSVLEKGSVRPTSKAVVEITAVGELTSESRVAMAGKGDPILKGDLIGNLAYDQELKLNFSVLGDFDLNSDGYPDPNGSQRVMEIIGSSGGTVVGRPSPAVNFVVMGAEPKLPEPPGPGASEAEESEYNRQQKRHLNFRDLKDQVRALAVPVISPELFMTYTGYSSGLD